jgi:tRNA 2-selenouridine synthase
LFCNRLAALIESRGKSVIEQWQHSVRAGQTAHVVKELLLKHYDPSYARSVERNFRGWSQALELELKDRHATSVQAAAKQLIRADTHTAA